MYGKSPVQAMSNAAVDSGNCVNAFLKQSIGFFSRGFIDISVQLSSVGIRNCNQFLSPILACTINIRVTSEADIVWTEKIFR